MTTTTMSATASLRSALRELPSFHTIGVGAGPANLSLAALHESATDERIALFDKQPGPSWHETLLHPGVRMQTTWLRDLVSVVDPTHKLTFLNYLVSTGRLFALLHAQYDFMPRREYMNYLTWASAQIDNIHYGVTIDRISLADDGFVVHSGDRPMARSEHLVVGVGTRPSMPAGFEGLPGDRAFLADDLLLRIGDLARNAGAPIAVVGGGQTGLECVLSLLHAGMTDILWLGRRQWFQTMDDSPAANEFYRPAHQRFLQNLPRAMRRRLVTEQKLTNDATTPGALRVLYQANYDRMLELGRFPASLLPGREVTSGEMSGDQLLLNCSTNQGIERHPVQHMVIATGRETVDVPFDADLRARIETDEDGEMIVDRDYSVRWTGRNGHRIYALNRGRMSHGIPDANLTLLPVRSAIVLNSMFGRELLEINDDLSPISWS